MFEINNDLSFIGYNYIYKNNKPVFNYRYIKRLIFAIILTILVGIYCKHVFILSYILLTILNFINGCKPWFYKFEINYRQPNWINYLRMKLLYGRKMSMQYLFIWDLAGAVIGSVIILIIKALV